MTGTKPLRARQKPGPRTVPTLRKASRDVRRQQLIEATVAVLAAKGYAALTVADVAKQAGLSPGIVIFHFDSKDQLLADTLRFLAIEYRDHWSGRMNEAGPSPAGQLRAILLSDFETEVFTPQRLAAWIAFWGETQGRPVYDDLCSERDAERFACTRELVGQVNSEGNYGLDPDLVMRSLECLTDGLWLGLAAKGAGQKGGVTAAEARNVVMVALAAFFPRHFPRKG